MMTRGVILGCMALCLMMLATLASAGTLQSDYADLEARRKALEDQRRVYEKQLQNQAEAVNRVADDLNNCVYETRMEALQMKQHKVYQTWRRIWESRLKEAEVVRKSSEEERRDLIQTWRELDEVRQALEAKRVEIERSHTRKGPGSPYETAFRKYMTELENQYFKRLENELFEGYRTYLDGAKGYLMFMKGSLSICENNEMGLPTTADN